MLKRRSISEIAVSSLGRLFELEKLDIGKDAYIKKRGIKFRTEVYRIPETGQLCLVEMSSPFDLMRMETAVVTVVGRDVPLFNADWMSFMGKETQMAELYDTMLSPLDTSLQTAYSQRLETDADISGVKSDDNWYDQYRYPFSYSKTGKKLTKRLSEAAGDYFGIFVSQLAGAPECDPGEKKEKVQCFAEKLFGKSGPAVNQIKKLFGDEFAERLILKYMYGTL